MTAFIFVLILLVVVLLNIILWKSGYITAAEKPQTILDRPVMDEKEKKAILKRIRRWKEEGKLSREEYERFYRLCSSEWEELA